MIKAIDFSKGKIDYSIETNTRTLRYYDMYHNPSRLAKGNSKLVNILIFDLPAVKSCLNCKDCAKSCYAMKAQRLYPATGIFRDTNMHMVIYKPKILKTLIVNQLRNTNITTVRIHSSGDFFSQEYIKFWHDVIKMFPKIKFYAYTKVDTLLDFSAIETNSNFNLIRSVIDGKINFGSLDYCKELNKMYGSFICPATMQKDVKCGKECTHCITKKNVCFVEH